MKRIISALALAGLLLALAAAPTTLAQAPEKPSNKLISTDTANIKSVTLYPDRALVVRGAKITAKPGVSEIVFNNLPATMHPDSLRAKGTDKIKVTNIKTHKTPIARPDSPEVKTAQKKIDDLYAEIKIASDKMEVLNRRKSFLDSVRLKASGDARTAPGGAIDVDALEKVMDFLDKGYTDIAAKKRGIDTQIKSLREKLDLALREMKDLSGKLSRTRTDAIITVISDGAVGEIELSYMVDRAWWRAEYDLRATAEADGAELQYYGVIYQETGEDWNDAKIMLTTAQPALATAPPKPTPRVLQIRPPLQEKSSVKSIDIDNDIYDEEAATLNQKGRNSQNYKQYTRPLILDLGGLAVTYALPRRETIPSAPAPHRTLIASTDFKPKKTYVTVPRITDKVYLQAEITNTSKLSFLSGRANIYLGPDYMGTTDMPEVSPTEKFKINFGVDQQIKVERERVRRYEEEFGGFLKSSGNRITYEYKITLQSFKQSAADVIIKDTIPISGNKKIKVTLLSTDPAPQHVIKAEDTKDETVLAFKDKGVMEWRLKLAADPKKKNVITFSYKVEHPRDVIVDGLE